jgi:hypothetical protein
LITQVTNVSNGELLWCCKVCHRLRQTRIWVHFMLLNSRAALFRAGICVVGLGQQLVAASNTGHNSHEAFNLKTD